MGAPQNSDRQKCGSVLINIKTIKNKNKIFSFHCAFCSTYCDQLKKFSKHLEEKHLHHFENELENTSEEINRPILLFEPEEVKIEAVSDMEPLIECGKKTANISTSTEACVRVKETEASHNELCNIEEYNTGNLKKEHNENGQEETENCNIINCERVTNIIDMTEGSQTNLCDLNTGNVKQECDESDSEEMERCDVSNCVRKTNIINETTKKPEKPYPFIHPDFSSEEYSNDSSDVDFDNANDTNITINTKESKIKPSYGSQSSSSNLKIGPSSNKKQLSLTLDKKSKNNKSSDNSFAYTLRSKKLLYSHVTSVEENKYKEVSSNSNKDINMSQKNETIEKTLANKNVVEIERLNASGSRFKENSHNCTGKYNSSNVSDVNNFSEDDAATKTASEKRLKTAKPKTNSKVNLSLANNRTTSKEFGTSQIELTENESVRISSSRSKAISHNSTGISNSSNVKLTTKICEDIIKKSTKISNFSDSSVLVTNQSLPDSTVDNTFSNTTCQLDTQNGVKEITSPLNITKVKVPYSTKSKKHFCVFCKTLQTKLARHLLLKHKSEKEIKSILKLPKKHKERVKTLNQLRKNGDFLHNTTESLNTGVLIVSRQQHAKAKNEADDYVCCRNCKGFFSKRTLRTHLRSCGEAKKNDRTNIITSRKLTQYIHEDANQILKTKIFPILRADEITSVIRYDDLIIKYGNKMSEKYTLTHQHDIVRSHLRLLGRFKIAVIELCPDVEYLKEIFKPQMYDTCIKALLKVANWDDSLMWFKTPAVAQMLTSLVKKCGHKQRTEYIKTQEEYLKKNVENFLLLWEKELPKLISRKAYEDQTNCKRNKKIILHSKEDIKKLYTLDEDDERSRNNMDVENSSKNPVSVAVDCSESESSSISEELPKKKRRSTSPCGKTRRARWTLDERKIITSHFGCLRELEKLPSLAECFEVVTKFPVLKNRTPQQIKSWIDNQRRYK